jgi:hypothetical protein
MKNLGLLCLSFLVALGAGELLVQTFRPQPTFTQLVELVGTYYAPSDYNTFQLKADYRGYEPSMEHPGRTVTITANAHG